MSTVRRTRPLLVQTMTAGQINKELDRLDERSKLSTAHFIKAGRGYEKYSETANKTDQLSLEYMSVSVRQSELNAEIRSRMGHNASSRLPLRGFGPIMKGR